MENFEIDKGMQMDIFCDISKFEYFFPIYILNRSN